MSTWTKIQKISGIRKGLVQKEEITDKKLVDEFIFSLATFAYEYLQDWLAGQNKLENAVGR